MASRQHEFVEPPPGPRGDPPGPPGGPQAYIPHPGSRTGSPVPPEVRRAILQEVGAGRKAVDVAREYGVHPSTLSRWMAKEKAQAEVPEPPPPAPKARGNPKLFPQETGRYSRPFKEEVLRQVRSGRPLVEVARQYQVPEKTIHRWQEEAKAAGGELRDPQSTRPPTNASPINEEHQQLVLSLKREHPNMGPAQIQSHLKRFHALKLSRHLIGRIFAQAGIPLQKRDTTDAESDPARNRFEMSRPNELWAVDFKEFWVHSEKAQALFALDDFSRFCVAFALTQNPTAELAIQTLRQAIQRYGRPERILSDRGPQFHAWNGMSQFDEFLGGFLIDHTVTKAHHWYTNGKIEAFNRSLEAELLDVEEFASLKEAEEKIRAHVARYNFSRPHMGIGGLVPADRYLGMVEEAQRAMVEGLKQAGPGLRWLAGIMSQDGASLRHPTILQLLLHQGKLELVVLGRRFTLG